MLNSWLIQEGCKKTNKDEALPLKLFWFNVRGKVQRSDQQWSEELYVIKTQGQTEWDMPHITVIKFAF